MQINALAALSAKAPLTPYSFDPGPLAAGEVQIKVTHCGICHSDVHLIDNDWGISQYPLVPGHEAVGVVEEVGAGVRTLKPGQRVGVGWQAGACHHCEWCVSGQDNLCAQNQATCVGHAGGFADRLRVSEGYAFPVPEALPSGSVGPLLCGGITVFSPLRHLGILPTHRVGIVGIGGLGHLALRFSRAWGCEVTAFTSRPDKETEARGFGAHHVVSSVDAAAMAARTGTLDFIISTVNVDLDWPAYINLLRPNGTLCFVGVPPSPLTISAFPLIAGQRAIAGSVIGGRAAIREMLDFAARHGITAQTEEMPLARANEALDRVRRNQARYRMVLRMTD